METNINKVTNLEKVWLRDPDNFKVYWCEFTFITRPFAWHWDDNLNTLESVTKFSTFFDGEDSMLTTLDSMIKQCTEAKAEYLKKKEEFIQSQKEAEENVESSTEG